MLQEWATREDELMKHIDDLTDKSKTLSQQLANLEHHARVESSSHRSHENTVSLLEDQIRQKDEQISK